MELTASPWACTGCCGEPELGRRRFWADVVDGWGRGRAGKNDWIVAKQREASKKAEERCSVDDGDGGW